jgi:alkanesulfonate monooxygenase SsuD/methylene tetrahydromethanopterin reductase-like flavin-dependent oxidoreductase (luciferase family)
VDIVQVEGLGYDGVLVPEVAHDGLLPVVLAADSTSRIALGTSVLVAFARNPMSTAVAAWDLHRFSGGRLRLGLGSQVRPHIERRFAMPWSRQPGRDRRHRSLPGQLHHGRADPGGRRAVRATAVTS